MHTAMCGYMLLVRTTMALHQPCTRTSPLHRVRSRNAPIPEQIDSRPGMQPCTWNHVNAWLWSHDNMRSPGSCLRIHGQTVDCCCRLVHPVFIVSPHARIGLIVVSLRSRLVLPLRRVSTLSTSPAANQNTDLANQIRYYKEQQAKRIKRMTTPPNSVPTHISRQHPTDIPILVVALLIILIELPAKLEHILARHARHLAGRP